MGVVYLVEDEKLVGGLWALKELRISEQPSYEQDLAEVLFRREAQILSNLWHPGIPRFIDFLETPEDDLAILMEWVDGTALDEVLESLNRPLGMSEVVPIGLMAAQVLGCLESHDPPVVFRDLKPSNLMINQSGRIYFIDFGIARHFHKTRSKDTQELGTPGFCAPEQYGHGQSSPCSDIYALGTTLFHLLTRQDPQKYNFKFPALTTFLPAAQPGVTQLSEVLERCLQIQPKDRYLSSRQLLEALEAVWAAIPAQTPGSTQGLHLYGLNLHPKPSKRSLISWSTWGRYLRDSLGLRFGRKPK